MKIYNREDYVNVHIEKIFPNMYKDIRILREFIFETDYDYIIVSNRQYDFHHLLEHILSERILQTTDIINLTDYTLYSSCMTNVLPPVYLIGRSKAIEIIEKYDCKDTKINEKIHSLFPPVAFKY